MFKKIWKKCNY